MKPAENRPTTTEDSAPVIFLIGTRWFGVLGPCRRIVDELTSQGFRVLVFGQSDDHYARYHDGKAELVEINMRRSYTTFYSDVVDVVRMTRLARQLRPVAIHSFNPKPALLSYAVVLLSGTKNFFIGVTGLGNTFIRAPRLRPFITRALRRAAGRADFVFFQNDDDVEMFTSLKIGDPKRYRKFVGPGVDLTEFDWRTRPQGDDNPERIPTVICVSRLIWQKGIREFVDAARLVRQQVDEPVRFLLVGEFDREHPDCVDEDFIAKAVDDGVLDHVAWTDDVASLFGESDINVLHSYREGAPRAILEASAMKLPTVGSDAIGVRELVVDGETGFLVELKSAEGLAEAVLKLLRDKEMRERLGEAAYVQIAQPLSLVNSSAAQLTMYEQAGYVPTTPSEVKA